MSIQEPNSDKNRKCQENGRENGMNTNIDSKLCISLFSRPFKVHLNRCSSQCCKSWQIGN